MNYHLGENSCTVHHLTRFLLTAFMLFYLLISETDVNTRDYEEFYHVFDNKTARILILTDYSDSFLPFTCNIMFKCSKSNLCLNNFASILRMR